jgi:hypothetical protein
MTQAYDSIDSVEAKIRSPAGRYFSYGKPGRRIGVPTEPFRNKHSIA